MLMRFIFTALSLFTTMQLVQVAAFVPIKHKININNVKGACLPTTSKLSSTENDNDNELNEQDRMDMVRSLQKSFYAQESTDHSNAQLQKESGIVTNLPLWRVGWVELPGRANCLNVHEGQYTHMFETILNGPQPWYVGHLHLPGGFKMTRTGDYKYELKTWKDEINDEERFTDPLRSAVVGTLMRISDYRRLTDGRLVLLTQVLDRFVVDKIIQEFPYSVADVQILPDAEELSTDISDENFGKVARAAAVRKSFTFHDYECDKVKLPLAIDSEYLPTDKVAGEKIAKLLPFTFYSADDSSLNDVKESNPSISSGDSFSGGEPSLERVLVRGRVLRNPLPIPGVEPHQTQSTEVIETLLWLALDDFCQLTKFKLPDEVLCLMPSNMSYLDMQSPKQYLSTKYPNLRRQKRLSYTAAAFLENTDLGLNLRQILLAAPSTKARLIAVLQRFELINEAIKVQLLGEFQ